MNFFLSPASTKPLVWLRVSLSLVLIAQAWMLRHSVDAFFANDGIIQGELAEALSSPGLPKISWLVHALSSFSVSEASCIHLTCGAYFLGLILLAFGVFGRITAAFCWFLHWTLMSTGQTTNYGVDLYAHVFLFYLIWFPSRSRDQPSSLARLGLRLIQIHLCITYFLSAYDKSLGSQWWNGELIWRALYLPVYRQFDTLWLANFPILPQIAGIAALALEFGYCIFIWPKKTRKLWIIGIVALHLGIAVFLGLTLFGILMCCLTVAAFFPDAEVEINDNLALQASEL